MSQVCNNPIITFMSIVIISCDTTQVLYITRYCVYIYKDMTRHGATIRHIRKKLFSEKEKGKRKNYDQCSHITQNFPRPFLNQPNLKPYTQFLSQASLGYHIWTNFKRSGLKQSVSWSDSSKARIKSCERESFSARTRKSKEGYINDPLENERSASTQSYF